MSETSSSDRSAEVSRTQFQKLARLVLAAFVLTFIISRIVVLLIMTHRMPDLFLHVGGTHVHHLNYGIFLLSGIGAFLIFAQPRGKLLSLAAVIYAIGLGLTFDEFGMWLHLGGPYWQRASFDAVVVIAAILGLISVAPSIRKFGLRQWLVTAAICLSLIPFSWLLGDSLKHAQTRLKVKLEKVEAESPP